jgi:hypothetical protein
MYYPNRILNIHNFHPNRNLCVFQTVTCFEYMSLMLLSEQDGIQKGSQRLFLSQMNLLEVVCQWGSITEETNLKYYHMSEWVYNWTIIKLPMKNEGIWSKCTRDKIPINTWKTKQWNNAFIVVLHLEVTMMPSTMKSLRLLFSFQTRHGFWLLLLSLFEVYFTKCLKMMHW